MGWVSWASKIGDVCTKVQYIELVKKHASGFDKIYHQMTLMFVMTMTKLTNKVGN